MKKLLIILGILVLLVIGVLFVPPIYNRFTKPFFKNTVDAKEWYHQVDCENLTQVRDYCDRRGLQYGLLYPRGFLQTIWQKEVLYL